MMLSFVCVYINGNESTIYTILKIDDLQWENNIRLKDAHNFSAPNITYHSDPHYIIWHTNWGNVQRETLIFHTQFYFYKFQQTDRISFSYTFGT